MIFELLKKRELILMRIPVAKCEVEYHELLEELQALETMIEREEFNNCFDNKCHCH